MLSHFSPERYDHWRDRFLKHRRLTVILGAATPVPYVVVCMIAGAFKMRFSEFALLAIGFRVLRITTAAYVVLLFQQSI